MTAVEWLYELSKQREPDKFDWEKAKEMEKWQRMKFEIPELSDEDIEKSMRRYNITDFGQMAAYVVGAKWYREQLKQRQ